MNHMQGRAPLEKMFLLNTGVDEGAVSSNWLGRRKKHIKKAELPFLLLDYENLILYSLWYGSLITKYAKK